MRPEFKVAVVPTAEFTSTAALPPVAVPFKVRGRLCVMLPFRSSVAVVTPAPAGVIVPPMP